MGDIMGDIDHLQLSYSWFYSIPLKKKLLNVRLLLLKCENKKMSTDQTVNMFAALLLLYLLQCSCVMPVKQQ